MSNIIEYANHIFYGENLDANDLDVRNIILTDISPDDTDTINDITARINKCDDIQKQLIVSYMIKKHTNNNLCINEPYRSMISENFSETTHKIVEIIKTSPGNIHAELSYCIDDYFKKTGIR
jgi:hypothetical protein